MPILQASNISKNFGGVQALKDVSFDLPESAVLGLIGTNGSGKSTLLNIIAGLEKPTSGIVKLDSRRIDNLRANRVVGYGLAKTHQIPKPFSNMTAVENVAVAVLYGRRNIHSPRLALQEAERTLSLVGMRSRKDAPGSSLTVQEKKRLEFARAIATGASVLLLDEVFAGLSPEELKDSIQLFRALQYVSGGYDGSQVIWDISLKCKDSSITVIVGPNGAGKTTTLKTVNGLLRPWSGRVYFGGRDITDLRAFRRVEEGIASCPEGRRLFPGLSTEDNLRLGAYSRRARRVAEETLDFVYRLFPRLRERSKLSAGRLSGGEQQMVSIGRALMTKPKIVAL